MDSVTVLSCLAFVSMVYGEISPGAVNLLRRPGVTCQASSEHGSGYACSFAYDGITDARTNSEWSSGGEETGSYIQITFPEPVIAEQAKLYFRCYRGDQNQRVKIQLSNGKVIEQPRTCNGGGSHNDCGYVPAEEVSLCGELITSIKLTGEGTCDGGNPGNTGLREIEVFGYVDTNLAEMPGVTCSASTEYSSTSYSCSNAYNGVIDPRQNPSEWAARAQTNGAWIKIDFPKNVLLYKAKLWFRCYSGDQSQRYVLTFPGIDGVSVSKSRTCNGGSGYDSCDSVPVEVVDIGGVLTDSVKITTYENCPPGSPGNQGLREVSFIGQEDPTNIARMDGVTCEASSEYSSQYACEMAYDGVSNALGVSEWSSDSEGAGSWIKITFPEKAYVVKAKLYFRCYRFDQNSGYTIELSDGSQINKLRTCNGGSGRSTCSTVPAEEVDVDAETDYIKITGTGTCGRDDGNTGLREVEVLGFSGLP